jgi:hypothetical protein
MTNSLVWYSVCLLLASQSAECRSLRSSQLGGTQHFRSGVDYRLNDSQLLEKSQLAHWTGANQLGLNTSELHSRTPRILTLPNTAIHNSSWHRGPSAQRHESLQSDTQSDNRMLQDSVLGSLTDEPQFFALSELWRSWQGIVTSEFGLRRAGSDTETPTTGAKPRATDASLSQLPAYVQGDEEHAASRDRAPHKASESRMLRDSILGALTDRPQQFTFSELWRSWKDEFGASNSYAKEPEHSQEPASVATSSTKLRAQAPGSTCNGPCQSRRMTYQQKDLGVTGMFVGLALAGTAAALGCMNYGGCQVFETVSAYEATQSVLPVRTLGVAVPPGSVPK